MNILIPLVFISLLSGQLIRIPLYQGITIYPHDICITLVLMYWFFYKRKPIHIPALSLLTPIKYFLLIALVSLVVNSVFQPVTELFIGFAYCVRFFLYACLYFIVSEERKIRWDVYLYGTGVLFSLFGLTQFFLYPDLRNLSYVGWDPHFYRLFSTFLDPNFAGIFIVITFFLGLYLYQETKMKCCIVIFQGILLISLILTLSRGSWLAFILPFVWFIWKKRMWNLFFVLGAFLLLLFFLPLPYRQMTSIFRQESSSARLDNWIYGINLIKKKPLIGYGFNMISSQKPVSLVSDGSQISHSSAGLDNSFLFILATTGIIGGISWIYLLSVLWNIGSPSSEKGIKHLFGLPFQMSLLAIGIHSVFTNSMFYPWIMIWVWIMAGIIETKKLNTRGKR